MSGIRNSKRESQVKLSPSHSHINSKGKGCHNTIIHSIETTSPVGRIYRYWQNRILCSLVFGYAAYYLVRVNFSMAIPGMCADLGYTKTEIGSVISIWSVVYGVGKFCNGYLSDRSNSRLFMSLGLVGAALTSFVMSFGEGIFYFVIIWGIFNAWFQSMGWPPVSKLLTHWYPPTQLGTKWGIANLSHQIGGAIGMIATGYLIMEYGWRSAFYVPAFISLGFSALLYVLLRDTPRSLGLSSIEVETGLIESEAHLNENDQDISTKEVLRRIFCNKMLWYVCLGNMFLYIVRMGFMHWTPSLLSELKGASLTSSGWQLAGFEVAGMAGGIAAGWISDKLFSGRRGPVSLFYMIALVACLIYFWYVPAGYDNLNAIAMFAVGFFVYGPQVLVGVAAADFASKKAVGMAVGLTGSFGYLGAAISGYGTGWIADNYGWNGGFIFFITSAILACIFFALTWNSRAKVLEKNERP